MHTDHGTRYMHTQAYAYGPRHMHMQAYAVRHMISTLWPTLNTHMYGIHPGPGHPGPWIPDLTYTLDPESGIHPGHGHLDSLGPGPTLAIS